MRRTWLIVAVTAALFCAGCKSKPKWWGAPGAWPNVECPPGSGVTAAERLQEIINWAEADGSGKALEAKGLATLCAEEHDGVNDVHCQKVFQAWTFAKEVATHPELPPHQKDQLWQSCADELTHESDGS